MTVLQSGSQIYERPAKGVSELCQYPIDMSSCPALAYFPPLLQGVAAEVTLAADNPAKVAQHALVDWNRYLGKSEEGSASSFLGYAYWFVEHELSIGDDRVGWPISSPHPDVPGGGPWLSALAQGLALSVLIRAYQLSGQEVFLEVAQRAARTFEKDILDGGVNAPIGEEGIFLEEVSAYPATHALGGCLFALLGLYDYVAFTGDARAGAVIERVQLTLHTLLREFDAGFWTYTDLLHRTLASPDQQSLHAELLEVLAGVSGCEHCLQLSARWTRYRDDLFSRLRYELASRIDSVGLALWKRVRATCFPISRASLPLRTCVPITRFPITGGTRTFLSGLAAVTKDRWQIEYLTQRVGPHATGFTIHKFGMNHMSPWQFPMVWLYSLAGLRKLLWLLRHGSDYHLILPQDGVFTSAFAAIAGKLAGVRVVCIDHGNLTLIKSQIYRSERLDALAKEKWPVRLLAPALLTFYWPSLSLMAQVAARFVDHYLIPGVAGDGVEEICSQLHIPASRVTRFGSMIDVEQYGLLDRAARAEIRSKNGLASDAILVAMVCRLSPAKGLDVALESIQRALSAISPQRRERVRIIIAGDGLLRTWVEEEIRGRELSRECLLRGELSKTDVISLLGVSDIFLYTSTRGACLSMAVLEAMASGCAVIASTMPLSNERLLAGGRGITIPAGDIGRTSEALVRLMNDLALCEQMGGLARDYVAANHSATVFGRVLTRATYSANLDELLHVGKELEQ
jgi:glycosyltransferase involved in cell wall biosynthesis